MHFRDRSLFITTKLNSNNKKMVENIGIPTVAVSYALA